MTTKLHLCTDEKGTITPLNAHRWTNIRRKTALDLVRGVKSDKVIADKAYDTDWLLFYLESEGIEAVIPSKATRPRRRQIDYRAYKQ